MSLHKLHIIGKNRDAVATQKGFTYQQLKTLEDWVSNRINNGDEDIYCEYEDDIFTQDSVSGKLTFKQIKLYSTNFSFTSESLVNALENFFSLYVKGEYSLNEVEFVFETNVSVAGRNVGDNDAKLLSDWNKNQGLLSEELLGKIRVRMRKILDNYVKERLTELSGKEATREEAEKAKIVYDSLSDQDIDQFINCIKWIFHREEPNVAVENVVANIKANLTKLPLPLEEDRIDVYFALLLQEVMHKSIQDEPEARKLTKDQLDLVLLSAGEDDDKWYVEIFQQFNGYAPEIFLAGEFQAVVSAASYCRWKNIFDGHREIWLNLLMYYIGSADIPLISRRKAIYEYTFLKIGHNFKQDRSISPISGDQSLIMEYIESWEREPDLRYLELDIVFLQLVKAQIKGFGLKFPMDVLKRWELDILHFLNRQEENESNADMLCEIYELQGHLAQVKKTDFLEGSREAFSFYRKILPLLEKANFYSLSQLYAQMQEMTKNLAELGGNDEIVEAIDEFMGEIEDHAIKSGHQHYAAKNLVERADSYINKHDLPSMLKALELLHKAKEKWRLEYTNKGYILSLLELSQVYEAMGMRYAAKYYAMIASWNIWQAKDDSLRKYLPRAIFFILHIDFLHGAWAACLSEFEIFLKTKIEFDEKGIDYSSKYFLDAISEITFIAAAGKIINPCVNGILENIKSRFDGFWTDHIDPLSDIVTTELADPDKLNTVLQSKLSDMPWNDIGKTRKIRFVALGNEWNFIFENSEMMTGISEEFIANLQIHLCEIAQSYASYFKTGESIVVHISKGHFQHELIGENEFKIWIPDFDSTDEEDINIHYRYLSTLSRVILESVCKLEKEEYLKFYTEELLKRKEVGRKVCEAYSFQRIYKHSIIKDSGIVDEIVKLPEFTPGGLHIRYVNWLSF